MAEGKRIVHLGFGNFHRAHQAWYTARAGGGWIITGVAMTRPDLRDALAPDGFAYTLAVQDADGLTPHRMAVHDDVLVLPEDPGAVIAAITDADTQIVTLTVTEKGYALRADGRLDLDQVGVAADIGGDGPKTAVGVLARGLIRRAGHDLPLTVISCDNLPDNGHKLKAAVARFADAAGAEISGYLDRRVGFPNTMVDRITPATTDALRDQLREPAPVLTEAFTEWVIEDAFTTPRPVWENAGAIIADDVAPYEARKLHLLNGAHSLLAYGGLMRGHDFVHQAMADPALAAKVQALWDEADAVLPASIVQTLPGYRAALLDRFGVAAMKHRLDQIALDGSQKLPVRIVPILKARQTAGQPAEAAETAIAAWFAYLHRGEIAADPGAEAMAGAPVDRVVVEGSDLLGLSHLDERAKLRIRSAVDAFASDAWPG